MLVLETIKKVTVVYNFGDLADWFGALATFAAVIVSLYLANRHDHPRIHFSFVKKDKGKIRITNKSYQPIELMIKIDDDKRFIKVGLPPLKVENPNMRSEEPFNHDMIVMGITNSSRKIHVLKAHDLITKTRYHAICYLQDGEWIVKQYRLFHLRKFAV